MERVATMTIMKIVARTARPMILVWVLTMGFGLSVRAVGEETAGKAVTVSVRPRANKDGWQLFRDGEPYAIRGVGGSERLELLAQIGGNSVRTWNAENLEPLLDRAQRLGLTVTVGIWLGHERHGFNYNDAQPVAEQLDMARKIIERYCRHPAVLLWGIGNEMEAQGDNAAVWMAINAIAAMAKEIDPHHPTMTVIAEIGGNKVRNVHRLCPAIDIVGINSYAGAASLPRRYREAGGKKPYILTEFGPRGHWETRKNDWGVAPEATSTAKAEVYRASYEKAVLGEPNLCLGAYAFLWGHKQETTATWFGMLLPDGSRLEVVDTMGTLWTGKAPTQPCPKIVEMQWKTNDRGKPGDRIYATLRATAPSDAKVDWTIQAEPANYSEGGDAEAVPPRFPQALLRGDRTSAEIRLPNEGGGYRLFVAITDRHGGAATANLPFHVDAPVVIAPARKATLPLVVYREADIPHTPYAPSGWMGNNSALQLDLANTNNPHQGKTCIKAEYSANDQWSGIVWQNPPSDWGDRPGGWDLTGARQLSFWARGDVGGEVITFEMGILKKDKKYHDTANVKLDKVTLAKEWKHFVLPLGKQDLTRIKTGFVFVLSGQGKPMTFYLDDIVYE